RHLKYYNGLQIHRAAVLKSLRIQSSGYGFQAEVLVKSLRLTRTFTEVPMELREREKGRSKAFRLRNVIDVVRTLKLLCALEWGMAGRGVPATRASLRRHLGSVGRRKGHRRA